MDGSGDGGGTETEPYVPVPKEGPTKPTITIGDVTIDLSSGPVTIDNRTYSVEYGDNNDWTITVDIEGDEVYGGDVGGTASNTDDILREILAAINALRRELVTYNNNLVDSMREVGVSVVSAIKYLDGNIEGYFDTLQSQLSGNIETLQDNLQASFEARMGTFSDDLWKNLGALDSDIIGELYKDARFIADSLSFEFETTDIVTWLKKIYAKLSRGPSGMSDPTEDPTGWLEDLENLLLKLLEGALGTARVAELASMLGELSSRFPISIPWDMMAIITLFAGEPVTPQYSWPIYNGNTKITELSIDLEPYEDVAVVTRKLSVIAFAAVLIMHTNVFLKPLNSSTRRGGD